MLFVEECCPRTLLVGGAPINGGTTRGAAGHDAESSEIPPNEGATARRTKPPDAQCRN